MPTVRGDVQSTGSLGIIPVPSQAAMEQFHRNLEGNRMSVEDESEAITDISEARKVFVYNVGAWPHQVNGGSLGPRYIFGLAETEVLQGDLAVSAPLEVLGIPSEVYPGDGQGRRIYHNPRKSRGNLSKHPGLHLAMEFIGAGDQARPEDDLRPYGVFISLQREQKQPGKNADPETLKAFAQWEKDVRKAQGALRKKYSEMLRYASDMHTKGKFSEIAVDEKYFMIARILKKTKVECRWLENTEASNNNKLCITGCGAVLPAGSLKCGQCGEKQVTEEKFAAEMKRLQALNS